MKLPNVSTRSSRSANDLFLHLELTDGGVVVAMQVVGERLVTIRYRGTPAEPNQIAPILTRTIKVQVAIDIEKLLEGKYEKAAKAFGSRTGTTKLCDGAVVVRYVGDAT